MRRTILAFACLVVLQITDATSADDSKQTTSSDKPAMGFLEVGRSYTIHFTHAPPEFKWNGALGSKEEDSNDKTIQLIPPDTLEVFKVIKRSTSSWVLLEFPASAKDYCDWYMAQHVAAELAQLQNKRDSNNNASAPALQEVMQTIEAQLEKIKTKQIWVNLDHALTISPIPSESGLVQMMIGLMKPNAV